MTAADLAYWQSSLLRVLGVLAMVILPAGAFVYVFSPSGELQAKQPAPADMPMRCAFGDADLSSLYVTTEGGELYRARNTGLKGIKRW